MPAAEKAFSETYHTVFTVEYWGGGGVGVGVIIGLGDISSF